MAVRSRKTAGASPSAEALHQRIAEKAYELYCGRGRRDGDQLRDWHEAERMVLEELGARDGAKTPRGSTKRSTTRRSVS